MDPVDVLVVGGGNAALCAALTAREAGARVLLAESAPEALRGGNSVHTRNLRCMHAAPEDVLTEAYLEDEYWEDLRRVTAGITDEPLARLAIRESGTVRPWMARHGVRFQPSLGGTLHLSRTNAFFLGGGKALVNAYFRSARALGCRCPLRRARHGTRDSRRALRIGDDRARGARRDRAREVRRARLGRLRIEPRMAARSLGPAGGQLPRARHRVQPGRGAEARPGMRRARPWAILRRATWSRWTRARPSTTAASSRASIASRSASS